MSPRAALTTKSVSDLLSEFSEAPSAPTKSEAQLERESRIEFFNSKLSELVHITAEYSRGTSEVDELKKFLTSLVAAKKTGIKALASVPDMAITAQLAAQSAAVFADTTATPTAPSTPSPTAPEAELRIAAMAYPEPENAPIASVVASGPGSPEHLDAALKASRAKRGASTTAAANTPAAPTTVAPVTPNDEWNMPDAPASLAND